ncbi:hypothetical protein LZZ90_00630 [Flavobacterium sp. SM15]|uniref:hypothetical protein n=1 Tax=Flavobacterium sp. SM15 TaxID=2908005 RepID=UPI001EDA96CD|nr:hypothetical protein [Flavobacterium sp. SM15]MCG2610007.1 hypothetical protein [Flavobacterium sp. SM15]
MENKTTAVEKLIENTETYIKTTVELYHYNIIYKSADIVSALAIKLVVIIAVALFSFLINTGIALWIGEQLNRTYYGFFIVATFYLLALILIYVFRKNWIKKPVSNFIINQLLKNSQK